MEENFAKRVMPHDEEAEKAVIGSLMLDREKVITVMDTVTAEDFYTKQYGLLFEGITRLFADGKPTDDPILLRDVLQEMDAPPEIASSEYLANIATDTPTSAYAEKYAKIVADKAQLRRLIRVSEDVANTCYAGSDSVDTVMEETEKKVFQVLQRRESRDFTPIKEIMIGVLNHINEISKQKGSVTGLASGFRDLDYKTSGFQNSDLILIAARPSMGKTAFVLNVANYIATHTDKGVAIFSLEMSKAQLANRLLAMESKVDAQLLRNGNLSDADWLNLMEGAAVMGRTNLLIDDTPGISIAELRSKCRKAKLENNLGIVLIDYLQLMSAGGKRSESRQQEISEISRSLKALARELEVPVIALSQLSRAVEQRPDHRPQLSDLRESGAIEQDADVVMFLYREDYYNHDTEKKGIAEVIIAKQRNGPIGDVQLVWMPQYTKFADMIREAPEGH